jgi:hypothetical protein
MEVPKPTKTHAPTRRVSMVLPLRKSPRSAEKQFQQEASNLQTSTCPTMKLPISLHKYSPLAPVKVAVSMRESVEVAAKAHASTFNV